MNDNDKIRVYQSLGSVSPCDSLDMIINMLQSIKYLEDSGECTDISIEVSEESHYDRSWHLVGYRLETDAEYNKRKKAENKLAEASNKRKINEKKKKEENERKEYERLKNKFEGKDK